MSLSDTALVTKWRWRSHNNLTVFNYFLILILISFVCYSISKAITFVRFNYRITFFRLSFSCYTKHSIFFEWMIRSFFLTFILAYLFLKGDTVQQLRWWMLSLATFHGLSSILRDSFIHHDLYNTEVHYLKCSSASLS